MLVIQTPNILHFEVIYLLFLKTFAFSFLQFLCVFFLRFVLLRIIFLLILKILSHFLVFISLLRPSLKAMQTHTFLRFNLVFFPVFPIRFRNDPFSSFLPLTVLLGFYTAPIISTFQYFSIKKKYKLRKIIYVINFIFILITFWIIWAYLYCFYRRYLFWLSFFSCYKSKFKLISLWVLWNKSNVETWFADILVILIWLFWELSKYYYGISYDLPLLINFLQRGE